MRHLFLLVWLLPCAEVSATHILAGELRYEHLSGLTYRVSMHFWTCLNSPSDRPALIIHYGDGTLDTVPRMSIVDSPFAGCCGGVRYSTYEALHTYPGPGAYSLRCEDQNRTGGILNVPNSVNQSFCVDALLVIDDALGPNSSVRFTNSPTSVNEVWSTLLHDTMPAEDDGDSLSFDLVVPLGLGCAPITGFVPPSSQPGGWHWLDPATGVFHWQLPAAQGAYTVAIRASEWRNGQVIGQVTRDMMICVPLTVLTGVEEHLNPSWSIYPGLADEVFWIEVGADLPLDLSVFDAQGRLVERLRTTGARTSLQVHRYAPGIYTLRDQQGRSARFTKR